MLQETSENKETTGSEMSNGMMLRAYNATNLFSQEENESFEIPTQLHKRQLKMQKYEPNAIPPMFVYWLINTMAGQQCSLVKCSPHKVPFVRSLSLSYQAENNLWRMVRCAGAKFIVPCRRYN